MDKSYAPLVLRIGMGLVFLWFGITQVISPGDWAGLVPDFLGNGEMWVNINGYFEIVFALLLILGKYVRIVSGILALHLLGITFNLGYGPSAVRDLGLFVAMISIFLMGPDRFSLDYKKLKANS